MVYVRCNYCEQDDSDLVNEGPDLLLNRPGHYRLVRCRNCGLIYQNPQPTREELPNLYPDEYEPFQRGIVGEQASAMERFHRRHEMERRYKRIRRHMPQPGRLLEVGSSTGLFLATMREQGWQVTGVELSGYAAEFTRQTYGIEVATGTLEETRFPDNAFDLVALWDVFEHVLDPKATLAEIARILRPGASFVASLPNPTGFEAKWFGSDWLGWDRPRHLHIFTPQVMENYLRDAGFGLTSVESFNGRLGVTLMSLEFRAKAQQVPEAVWQRRSQWLYTLPLRLATLPIYKLAEAFNKTSIMTVFAHLRAD